MTAVPSVNMPANLPVSDVSFTNSNLEPVQPLDSNSAPVSASVPLVDSAGNGISSTLESRQPGGFTAMHGSRWGAQPVTRITYTAKKTVAQGMMDIALLTANANQLRYVLEMNTSSLTYYVNIVLIPISIILQIIVGIILIVKGRFDFGNRSDHPTASKLNNFVVVGVFMITVINILIAAFGMSGHNTGGAVNQGHLNQ